METKSLTERERINTLINGIKNKLQLSLNEFNELCLKKTNLQLGQANPETIKAVIHQLDILKNNIQILKQCLDLIYKCSTFASLLEAKSKITEILSNSIDRYNNNFASYRDELLNITKERAELYSFYFDLEHKKIDLLKLINTSIDNIVRTKQKVSTPPLSEPIKRTPLDSSAQSLPKAEGKKIVGIKGGPRVTTTNSKDIKSRIRAINTQIYALKLEYAKIDSSNTVEKNNILMRLEIAEKTRIDALIQITGTTEIGWLLDPVVSAEDAAIERFNNQTIKKNPEQLTIDSIEDKILELYYKINDLKIYGVNSVTYTQRLSEEKDGTTISLEKYIEELSNYRDAVFTSSFERMDPKTREMIESLKDLEGKYNLEGGYSVFRSIGGKIDGEERTKLVYKRGCGELKKIQRILRHKLMSEYRRKTVVYIKTPVLSYDSLKQKRDEAYERLYYNLSTPVIDLSSIFGPNSGKGL